MEAEEAAVTRRIKAFDTAALAALNLNKEIIRTLGKGDKAPRRANVKELCKRYEEASELLDGARKMVGDDVMGTVKAIRLSREIV